MSTVKDPVRLVLDPSCPDNQRELLRHGTNIEPPRDKEALVWQALIGAIGAAAVGGSTDVTTTKTAATKLNATGLAAGKIVVAIMAVVVGLIALVGLGAYLLASWKRPLAPAAVAPVPAAEPPATAPSLSPATGEPIPAWEDAPAPEDTGRARPAPVAHRSARAGRLREETAFIKDARQALRQGDAARALRVLDECRRLFPAGVLEQERERLVIEALVKNGRASDASVRAAEFLRKHPDSPHAGAVRALGLQASGSP